MLPPQELQGDGYSSIGAPHLMRSSLEHLPPPSGLAVNGHGHGHADSRTIVWGQSFGNATASARVETPCHTPAPGLPEHAIGYGHDGLKPWNAEDEAHYLKRVKVLKATAWLRNFDHYMHAFFPLAFGLYVGIMFACVPLYDGTVIGLQTSSKGDVNRASPH